MKENLTKLLLLSFLLCSFQFSFAQFTANGKVIDADGEALIGATVQVKGTTTGTVTDIDGNYSLRVDADQAILVFSYTGFESAEYSVSSASPTLDVTMDVLSEQLTEIVVVQRSYGWHIH